MKRGLLFKESSLTQMPPMTVKESPLLSSLACVNEACESYGQSDRKNTAAMMAVEMSLERFVTEGYGKLLAYPSEEDTIAQKRLAWIKAQGVQSIHSYGPKPIGGFKTLGLGYSGLVLRVSSASQRLALKLRRSDAPNASFAFEAEAIATANQFQVGPQLISHNDDCLLMEYLPGPKFIDWLHSPAATFEQTWAIIHPLLDQAFHLDQAGLDHGDLRCVTEHVHIETTAPGDRFVLRPVVIDFGKASRDRRPANVTTLTQGLFLSTTIARTISSRFSGTVLDCQNEPRRSQLIHLLRNYKNNPCQKTHQTLLNFLKP